MKRTALNLLMTLVCAAAVAAVAVAASSSNLMTAKIPFAFNIGGQTLPAGTYTVSHTATPGVVIFRNEQTAQSVGLITNLSQGATVSEKAMLEFRRYGNQYFLGAIKQGFSANCFVAPRSRRERETAHEAKHLAQQQTGPEIVTVTAE